jgi:hypothetical protein
LKKSENRNTARNPIGIEMIPGLRRSKRGFSRPTRLVSSPANFLSVPSATTLSFFAATSVFSTFALAAGSGAAARSASSLAIFAGAAATTFSAAALSGFG